MTAIALLFLFIANPFGAAPAASQATAPAAQETPTQTTPNAAVTSQQQAISDAAAAARKSAIAIVAQIQKADYEGDRAALNKLYDQLVPFVDEPAIASRVRYWRGFAKWRRAINGFNETPTPDDLALDLTAGESEFDAAILRDPNFVDAKVGAASCALLRAFLEGTFSKAADFARMREVLGPPSKLLKEAQDAAPENPRLLWVVGPNQWNTPPASVGQAKAFETYERALKDARAQKNDAADPLEPSWGEPELLMNLAWGNLHRETPDLNAAESYAQEALKLVPNWHYVRDILLPQIRAAKNKPS